MGRKEIFALLTLASMQFFHSVDFMIIMPLGPQLMRLFGIGPVEFGWLVSSYTLGAGLMGLIGVFFLDRYDRKVALITVFTSFIFGTICCGLSNSYAMLLFFRAFTGAFGGLLGSLLLSAAGDLFEYSKRARAVGIIMGAFSIAAVVGVPMGLFLANHWNWKFPFLVLGVCAIPILINVIVNFPAMRGHMNQGGPQGSGWLVYKEAIQIPEQRYSLVFISLVVISQFLVIPFVSPSMVANVGFKESELFWIYFIGGVITIVSTQLIGKLADSYGKEKLFIFTVIGSMIPTFFITRLGITPIPIVLVLTSLFFIFISGRMIPAMSLMSAMVPPNRRGSFMGLVSSVQQFSSALAAALAGFLIIKDAPTGRLMHYDRVGLIAIGLSGLTLYFLKFIKPKY